MKVAYTKFYTVFALTLCVGLVSPDVTAKDIRQMSKKEQQTQFDYEFKTWKKTENTTHFLKKECKKLELTFNIHADGSYDSELFETAIITNKITAEEYQQIKEDLDDYIPQNSAMQLTPFLPDFGNETFEHYVQRKVGNRYQRLGQSRSEIAMHQSPNYQDAAFKTWFSQHVGSKKHERQMHIYFTNSFKFGEVGDQIVWHSKESRKNPLDKPAFSRTNLTDDVFLKRCAQKLVFNTPKDVKLNVQVQGYDYTQKANAQGGISHTLSSPKPDEINIPEKLRPFIYVSTATSWQQIAQYNHQRYQTLAKPTQQVNELAAQITQGLTTDQAKIQAIYRWVQTNIDYKLHEKIDAQHVELNYPRPLDAILQSKQGDCKDKTLLLIALLKTQGIETTTTIISLKRDPFPPIPADFSDHIFVYIPKYDVYLDAVYRHLRVGQLETIHLGKFFLRGDGQTGRLSVKEPNLEQTIQHITITPDGFAQGTSQSTVKGIEEIMLRQVFDTKDKKSLEKKPKIMAYMAATIKLKNLKQEVDSVQATIENITNQDYTQALTYKSAFKLPLHWQQSGQPTHKQFVTPNGITTWTALHWTVSMLNDQIDLPEALYSCDARRIEETIHVTLDKSLKALLLPSNIDFENQWFMFKVNLKQEGEKITLTRVYQQKGDARSCREVSFYPAVKEIKKIVFDHFNQPWMVETIAR